MSLRARACRGRWCSQAGRHLTPATGRVLLAEVTLFQLVFEQCRQALWDARPLENNPRRKRHAAVNKPNAFTARVPPLPDSNVGLLGMHLREPAAAPDVRGLRNT